MATVAEIVDYVCDVTGWNAAASSSERVAALRNVNTAWESLIHDGENSLSLMEDATETLSADQYRYLMDTDFSFTHSSDWPERILNASVTGNGVTDLNMRQVSLSEMRAFRDAYDTVSGQPQYWCMPDSRNFLVYPTPNTTYTLKLDYVKYPTALAESAGGNEALNEAVPARYHLELLGSRAIAMCKEQDGDLTEAEWWHAKADRSAEKYQGYVNTLGGVVQPVQDMWYRRRRLGSTYSDRSIDWR